MMSTQREYKSIEGTLILTDTGVVIKRSSYWWRIGSQADLALPETVTIPYSQIEVVLFKKARFMPGFINFSGKYELNGKNLLVEFLLRFSPYELHTFRWWLPWENKKFEEVKRLVEERIQQPPMKEQA